MNTGRGLQRILLPIFLLFLASILSNWIVCIAHGSQLVVHELESAAIAGNALGISNLRRIEVYLPDGYEEEEQFYPALYWLPGYNGSMMGSNLYKSALDNAIQSGRIPPAIAVFIDAPEGIFFLNSPLTGNWEEFMAFEVVPFIDQTYRTIPDSHHRGIMGLSVGGHGAITLPVLYPGIWGAVGANDPSTFYMWYPTRDQVDFPESVRHHFAVVRLVAQQLPRSVAQYTSAMSTIQIFAQMATAISPNADHPLLIGLPFTPEGKWIAEVRERWSAYDLTHPQTLAEHSDTLNDLLTITIIVPQTMAIPEISNPNAINVSNGVTNAHFIQCLESAGVFVNRLDMPGAHVSFMSERFTVLAEEVLKSIMLNETSVLPGEKMAALWGGIRSNIYTTDSP